MTFTLDPTASPCTLHKAHSPKIWRTVRHHVIPESWTSQLGQPQSERVVICDTAHYAIHLLIDALRARRTHPRMPAAYHDLAQEAVDWWTEQGQPDVPITSLEFTHA